MTNLGRTAATMMKSTETGERRRHGIETGRTAQRYTLLSKNLITQGKTICRYALFAKLERGRVVAG